MPVNINDLIEKKPHLKDTLRLYEKVLEFKQTVHNKYRTVIGLKDISYPSELIDDIFDSFSLAFNLQEESLSPLKEAMKFQQIDLTRLPLNEVPAFSLPYHEEELKTVLYLISKPYFIRLRNSYTITGRFWEEGKCPVCNSTPSVASINKDTGRMLYCSYCESEGQCYRTGCPNCQNKDMNRFEIIKAEGEEGFRIDLCNACYTYIKTIDAVLLSDYTFELLDILSIPMDIIAQNKGYRRVSPNPVGMTKMI